MATQMVRDYCTYTSDHAGGGSAHLKMILANLGSVEHSEETGDFVDLHRGHLQDLGCLVHRSEGQEVVVLLLRDEKRGNHTRRLVVIRVLGHEGLDGSVRLLSEFEGGLVKVILSVSMVGEGREGSLLSSCTHDGNSSALRDSHLAHHFGKHVSWAKLNLILIIISPPFAGHIISWGFRV